MWPFHYVHVSFQAASLITRVLLKTHGASNYGAEKPAAPICCLPTHKQTGKRNEASYGRSGTVHTTYTFVIEEDGRAFTENFNTNTQNEK